MLNIVKLTVVYPDNTKAVDKFTLHAGKEESVALAGENGAGKTTLMLAITGVLPIAEGSVQVDGITLEKKNLNDIRARTGLVFQNPDDQLFTASVYDDIAFGPRNYGLPEKQVAERVNQTLEELGITRLLGRSALKLSGGEKRLAAIAAVLSMNPSVLLFDEPTAFLDLKARRNLIRLLNKMPQTKLIASHDLLFLEEVCGRAVLMKNGTVFTEGAPADLFHDKKLMEDCGLEAI
ncbi:MAG: energy-coupling factor ABC transporter ATP-binding protein [Clostridiales bacterium]|jgi:cobalt/nickel transport system ATP-binding protein|nr:energy-coupling factor ABC transporter ATP-binding protein [Clostridiales bacterium]